MQSCEYEIVHARENRIKSKGAALWENFMRKLYQFLINYPNTSKLHRSEVEMNANALEPRRINAAPNEKLFKTIFYIKEIFFNSFLAIFHTHVMLTIIKNIVHKGYLTYFFEKTNKYIYISNETRTLIRSRQPFLPQYEIIEVFHSIYY